MKRYTPEFAGFEDEPIMTRLSHTYGELFLWAPLFDTALGSHEDQRALPWLLTSLHGDGGKETVGFKHLIRADAIQHCWNHPHFVNPPHLYVAPASPEVEELANLIDDSNQVW